MRKRRCSLCGGKLEDNRCMECGLDNSKNDDMYKNMINKSGCERKQLTHVHEEKTIQEKKPSNRQMQQMKPPRKFKGMKIIYILFIVGLFGFALWDGFREMDYGVIFESWNEEPEYEQEDPYQFVTRELSEYGEIFETVLEPGRYEVGVHIPEGLYTATVEDGFYGYLNLNDSENQIYYFIDLIGTDKNQDVRLYDGAVLEVSQQTRVRMYSENAQVEQMHAQETALVQEVMVTGNVQAGIDFEPGIYDIVFTSTEDETVEEGQIECTPSIEDIQRGIPEQILYFSDHFGSDVYRNVNLPYGTTIVLYGLSEVKLVPSPIISSEI